MYKWATQRIEFTFCIEDDKSVIYQVYLSTKVSLIVIVLFFPILSRGKLTW